MDTHSSEPDPQAGRITRLYERLAKLVRALGPNRQEAFKEYLDGQESQATDDTGQSPPEGDR